MEAQTSSGSGSGPRACRACAGSKAKCIFLPGTTIGAKCRRCNRLNKDCVMQTPAVRKRQPRTATRVERLEEKLDGLVSLLQSPQQVLEDSRQNLMAGQLPYQQLMPQLPQLPDTPSTDPVQSLSPPQDCPESSFQEETIHQDGLLYVYRSNMMPQFPFVVIPDRVTTAQLARTKPFLHRTILFAASYHDKAGQTNMAKDIFQYLSTHMVMENEKSLDLLQGLLVMMAWYHSHIHVARRMTLMLQLAIALVIDLGLSQTAARRSSNLRKDWSLNTFSADIPTGKEPTPEERRALLGLSFMSSAISTYVKEADIPPYSSDFTDDCMNVLEQTAEYSSDQYLIHLFRLQAIADEMNQVLPRYYQDLSLGPSAPISHYMKTLQSKLESFRSKLPLHLQQNPYLLMHYHSLLSYLTETALSIPLPSRQATLHACLISTHAFFSFMFSVPLIDWYKFTYVSWSQMRHIIAVLFKLSSFDSPDWDPSHVRGVLDLSLVMENIISQMEKIQAWGISNGQANAYGFVDMFLPKLREYREAFERKRAILLREPGTLHQQNIEPDLAPQMPLDDLMFGQLDDAFWQEVVVDWNMLPTAG